MTTFVPIKAIGPGTRVKVLSTGKTGVVTGAKNLGTLLVKVGRKIEARRFRNLEEVE